MSNVHRVSTLYTDWKLEQLRDGYCYDITQVCYSFKGEDKNKYYIVVFFFEENDKISEYSFTLKRGKPRDVALPSITINRRLVDLQVNRPESKLDLLRPKRPTAERRSDILLLRYRELNDISLFTRELNT